MYIYIIERLEPKEFQNIEGFHVHTNQMKDFFFFFKVSQ